MDPNSSRPMSYENLKILLQYAKANLRFELSRRIPSIRLTEKLVPLRIDKLTIDYNGIEVNDTKYEAHTVRQFHPDFIASTSYLPPDDTFCNGDWDLDEWGFDDYSSENVFTPGDLVFQVQWQAPRQKEQSEERKREIENRLKFVEWMIARRLCQRVASHWTGETVNNIFDYSCRESTVIELRRKVETFKLDLASYDCFENNVPLPFTKMVQVAIRSKNENLCWRYSGNLKYYEIRKQLMTWLLGNRKHVIQVNHLIVTNGILARLPENLRISVKMLQTQRFPSHRIQRFPWIDRVPVNNMLIKLEAIIQNDNRPLEIFETDGLEEDFDHPMALNAKKLVNSPGTGDFPDANRLIRIQNQKFHFSCSKNMPEHLQPEIIIRVIRDWIRNPREIGKCFSFEGSPWSVTNTVKQIQTTFDGLKTDRSIKIPVNNFTQISVLYESFIFNGNILAGRYRRFRLMTIEVVPV